MQRRNRADNKVCADLAGVVEPMIGQPFLRNDEPSFFAATLPLNGAIYNA